MPEAKFTVVEVTKKSQLHISKLSDEALIQELKKRNVSTWQYFITKPEDPERYENKSGIMKNFIGSKDGKSA